jgi:SAM-dependent methyltransferase
MRSTATDRSSWNTFDLRALLPPGPGRCLDLGCGPGARADLTALGWHYVGLDYAATPAANVRGDAQCLPFVDGCFDLVVAASSFEHFPDPWAAAQETARVLAPGGSVVVSLSFLEPYHARSHYHMSHLGAAKLFHDVGLTVERVAPFEWTGPEATAQALFQLAPMRWLTASVVRPVLWLRQLAVRVLIARYPDGPKRERAREFLAEEPFRFTAGIKLRARRPPTGGP